MFSSYFMHSKFSILRMICQWKLHWRDERTFVWNLSFDVHWKKQNKTRTFYSRFFVLFLWFTFQCQFIESNCYLTPFFSSFIIVDKSLYVTRKTQWLDSDILSQKSGRWFLLFWYLVDMWHKTKTMNSPLLKSDYFSISKILLDW